jgi:hypothetical protein
LCENECTALDVVGSAAQRVSDSVATCKRQSLTSGRDRRRRERDAGEDEGKERGESAHVGRQMRVAERELESTGKQEHMQTSLL